MLCANKLGALGILLTDAIAGALGELSPSAAAILLTLRYRGSVTATAIAEIVGVSQPTAVRVVGGLIRQGLVARAAREGQNAPLRLTRAGLRRADALQHARLEEMERLLASLPDAQRAAFERALDAVLAAATKSRAFACTTCRLCDHDLCDGPRCPIGSKASETERRAGRRLSGRRTP